MWSQTKINSETNRVKHVYNQIDYLMMKKSYTHNLTEARSYAGTETYSDHRLVVIGPSSIKQEIRRETMK